MRNVIVALAFGFAGTALAQQVPPMAHGTPGAHGTPAAAAPGFRPTVLLETPLLGTEQRIYRLYTIDFASGGATPRHMHPGDEIALVTVGSVTLEMEGEPPRTFQVDQTFHPRPMTPHVARNASTTGPARVSVSSITEAGKPSTIMLPPAATN
ncbi:cupin domain-containing protein [Neoroseomonas soli]|uniref:Cupin domain-containing protein n=1 Tax=Neoroseomonas soli TaxID=1081025 RepID=A0A9X9WSG7_9PROT|nr:cupin domain-containing protein [Neoroseomonas soli]MBR0670096.1 cupin domain-containing protein [Neoroseomonas soli]